MTSFGSRASLSQSAASSHVPPFICQSPPFLFSQSSSAGSVPDLRAAPNATGTTSFISQPLAHAQSTPNLSNMAALNPLCQPFLCPDDFYNSNPIAKAMLGLQSDARDETSKLGKYVPELFSLRYGKIEDICQKMSYSEFMHMYTRMLVFMLRDDPHLVPDRIVFLNNLCAKAAKYRWPEVRNCYSVAITEMKRGHRTVTS